MDRISYCVIDIDPSIDPLLVLDHDSSLSPLRETLQILHISRGISMKLPLNVVNNRSQETHTDYRFDCLLFSQNRKFYCISRRGFRDNTEKRCQSRTKKKKT